MAFETYHVPRVFQAEEITKIPWAHPEGDWHWRNYEEPVASLGDFLVREYCVGTDDWEYKVVRRENFLKYYLPGSGRAETSGPPPSTAEIACAYAVTVDGFISIAHKAIRNPASPSIVWMPQAIWKRLAVCATNQGQFYIPCTETLTEPAHLRALICQVEKEPV